MRKVTNLIQSLIDKLHFPDMFDKGLRLRQFRIEFINTKEHSLNCSVDLMLEISA